MTSSNLVVAVIGGMILAFGLISRKSSESPLPPTLLAFLFGILIGPAALGWIDPAAWGERPAIVELATRLTLAVGLMGVALAVPREFPRRHAREMAVLIGLGMVLMWAVSTGLVHLLLGIPFWLAALIGAMLTATDPIAASPVVTGDLATRALPDRIRHAILFESGANDGLSYLFVFLPLLLLTRPADEALSHWLLHTLAWEVGAATVFGVALGWAAGHLLQAAERHGTIEQDWRLVYTVALGLFAAGAGRLIGSDEVLVIFAAGATFAQVVSGSERQSEERGQEAVNRFFSFPIFALVGAAIPWSGWAALGWKGPALAAAVLLLRRPLPTLLLYPLLPSLRAPRDLLFVGWFGPIAIAAVYYASVVEKELHEPLVWDVVSLIVCASVVAHAVTAAPFTRLYARAAGADPG